MRHGYYAAMSPVLYTLDDRMYPDLIDTLCIVDMADNEYRKRERDELNHLQRIYIKIRCFLPFPSFPLRFGLMFNIAFEVAINFTVHSLKSKP